MLARLCTISGKKSLNTMHLLSIITTSSSKKLNINISSNPFIRMISNNTFQERLNELEIKLPNSSPPKANYVSYVNDNNLLYFSGGVPVSTTHDQQLITGKINDNNIEQGIEACRCCALTLLRNLYDAVDGDMSRVKRIVKVVGMVNSESTFTSPHICVNGASDILVELLGEEIGKHSRSASGVCSLPLDISALVEMTVRIK